ncbi:MAG: transglutaminase domain-containing protein [Gammaproteobacteria bacterium]
MATPSEEAVRIRNSLIEASGNTADFEWTPAQVPQSFLQERKEAPAEFTAIARSILDPLPATASNFEKSLAIARHLMGGPFHGGGIMKRTHDTYLTMMNQGGGYCADFTQVFNGITLAAHIPVREWGMAFDGFSGDGHAFNEIYDEQYGQWVLIDSFYSLYFHDPESLRPLSALQVRKRLRKSAEVLEAVPIVAEEFGFKSSAQAIDYYRDGADQFYLWWGNNVFTYDDHPLVGLAGSLSRAIEEGVAILVGVHPGIHIVETESNRERIRELLKMRDRFLALSAAGAALLLLLLAQCWFYRRSAVGVAT